MAMRLAVKNQDKLLPELTQEIPANGIITVGSEPSASIQLIGEQVAPEQFVIVCEDNRMTLLCRVDGTVINGEPFPQGALHNLQPGDSIVVGDYTLDAETDEASEEQTARRNTGELKKSLLQNASTGYSQSSSGDNFERSLNDVLEGLRAEEKFYFQIQTPADSNQRVCVETEEMWLGWTQEGDCLLTADTDRITAPRAQIRKDWSGVVLYPLQTGSVWLNDEPLSEPHRLKNDDRLYLLSKENAKPCHKTLIKFHEPTALLVLDSILPKELPPPISLDEREKPSKNGHRAHTSDAENLHSSQLPPTPAKAAVKNLFFGYFSLAEIIIMAIGTLITAAMIFLILELY